ncbi:MAG: hypothetical protein PQJ49_03510 [Sphaerochaetaceae bacterium]|nr:hypothetical protein [Sphaerochaetaceae bacterium]MDC7248967.1 hypothetical protein [Sphaerochaetaceae bacterium]
MTEIEDSIHLSKLCQFMGVGPARIATILYFLEKQDRITKKNIHLIKEKLLST